MRRGVNYIGGSVQSLVGARPGDILYDTVVRGLHLRCTENSKTFYLYYRNKDGVPRRPKIGEFGILTLTQARDIATKMLAQVAYGRDPSVERRAARNSATNLNQFFEIAFKEHWANMSEAYRKEVRRIYTKDISPRIGSMLVKDIGYRDCARVQNAISSNANTTLAVLSKLLSLAERYELRPVNSNPCTAVERKPQRSRSRFATVEEIAAVGALLEKYKPQFPEETAFLYVMMFTGARPSEIGRATPSQLTTVEKEGSTYGVLEIPVGKNKDARRVYLPPQALRALEELPANRKLLCGARTPRRLWNIIREEAGCPDLWARDWRRTFATVGLSNGTGLDTLSEILGHRDSRTTKIYAKLIDTTALDAVKSSADVIESMMASSN